MKILSLDLEFEALLSPNCSSSVRVSHAAPPPTVRGTGMDHESVQTETSHQLLDLYQDLKRCPCWPDNHFFWWFPDFHSSFISFDVPFIIKSVINIYTCPIMWFMIRYLQKYQQQPQSCVVSMSAFSSKHHCPTEPLAYRLVFRDSCTLMTIYSQDAVCVQTVFTDLSP